MNLLELEEKGEVRRLKTSRKELRNLLNSAKRKLDDASYEEVSRESRLGLAYQCILTLAKLALRASGYRLKGRHDEHVRTLETLRATMGMDDRRTKYFHTLRSKRHRDLYEGDLHVSATELAEALKHAATLLAATEERLKQHSGPFNE